MIRLNVNIDHVATLRNQRDAGYPDPVAMARLCLEGGADGITAHLREDRRHIRDADVFALRELVPAALNLEMAATAEMAALAARLRPAAVTLVPERRAERTTEGGLDVESARDAIVEVRRVCEQSGARLSLFIEASERQVRLARELGAVQVEFHTGHYCDAPAEQRSSLLEPFVAAAELAHSLGMEVAAGHGLNTANVGPIAGLPHLAELNIGHSVIADALASGMVEAVRRLRVAIEQLA